MTTTMLSTTQIQADDALVDSYQIAAAQHTSSLSLPVSYHHMNLFAAIVDATMIVAISLLSGSIYHLMSYGSAGDLDVFFGMGITVAALFVSILQARRLYRPSQIIGAKRRLSTLILVWSLIFMFLAGVAFFLKISDNFSRGAVMSFFFSGMVGVIVARLVLRAWLNHALATGSLKGRNVVVLAEMNELADGGVVQGLQRHGYKILQHYTLASPSPQRGASRRSVSNILDDLIQFVRSNKIDEILLVIGPANLRLIEEINSALNVVPLPVRLIPDRGMRRLLARPLSDVGMTSAFDLQRAPLSLSERTLKRTFDTILAGGALLALMPFMLVVALLIKLDSKGPVFFRQTRAGFSGRIFKIYKFRTMTTMDDGNFVRQATKDDKRITRIGKFLRRASIDELPQLLNVINGEMSIVGPRPHALAHDNEYDKIIANYAFRHHVKPGITGWAQANGFRGETPTVDLMRARVEHDLWYINNWSIFLDIRTIFMTVMSLLSRNAY